ncbi:MAG: GIY-YIG nuclease family protein [Bacteroidia bacterium]
MNRLRDHNYFVYITSNPGRTVLYTGVTNDLNIRIQQHKSNKGIPTTFAGKYYCYELIYYERYSDINIAIEREKEIKLMKRETKFAMIKAVNPLLATINVYE